MPISTAARIVLNEQLEQMEGYRQYPYKDSRGNESIAIGRNLVSRGISRQEAIFMMNNDVDECDAELVRNISFYNDLDDVRKIVLINMCFNMGIGDLMQFKSMLTFLGSGNYASAADEMMKSAWSTQVPTRAATLAHMMDTGTY
jgi:lysozyme